MKFSAGQKVWAISYAETNEHPAGEYAGVIEDFFECFDGIEYYVVDIPSVPSNDGGWIISERCLRPRDDPDDKFSDSTPDKKSSWDSFKIWRPAELDVTA